MHNAREFTIRHPSLADAQATLDLMVTRDIAEYGEPDSNIEDIQDQWNDIDLDQDAWLAFSPEALLVGYAAVTRDGDGFTFDLYTHPTLAAEALTSHLLAQCEKRAYEQLDAAQASTQATTTTYISMLNLADRHAVEEFGFEPHKYHFGMRIDLETKPPPAVFPAGVRLRTAIPGLDDRMIYDFIQAAFDRPGRVPPSFERWHDFMMGAYNFESGLWFLAYRGEELIGAALCFDYPQYGWVRQLGVASQWRGQGLGSLLLQHVFGVFYERGHSRIGLVVDADNPKAYELYERIGMKRLQQYIAYRKTLSVS